MDPLLETIASRRQYDIATKQGGGCIVEYDGVSINLRGDLIDYEIYQYMVEGWYERQEAILVRKHLPPDVDVIELGAGIGYVSCVIDEVLHNNRTQLAVEPRQDIVPVLSETKQLNDAKYEICERGYSATSDTVDIECEQPYWTATTGSGEQTKQVAASNLRELCAQFDLSTFSLVMDIEGAEYELLLAELELLETRCPLLVVEFHDEGPYAPSYDDELVDSSFELVKCMESVCVYRNPAATEETEK